MKAVLDLLAFVDRLEDESREPICLWPNLELARIVVDDDPSERLKPPPTERHWVTGVDDDLLPLEAHGKTIRHRSSSTCPTTPVRRRRRRSRNSGATTLRVQHGERSVGRQWAVCLWPRTTRRRDRCQRRAGLESSAADASRRDRGYCPPTRRRMSRRCLTVLFDSPNSSSIVSTRHCRTSAVTMVNPRRQISSVDLPRIRDLLESDFEANTFPMRIPTFEHSSAHGCWYRRSFCMATATTSQLSSPGSRLEASHSTRLGAIRPSAVDAANVQRLPVRGPEPVSLSWSPSIWRMIGVPADRLDGS